MQQELMVLALASLPVSELRGAIPLAMGVFDFSPIKAYVLAVIGNIFLIFPFLVFLHKFSEYLMHRWYFFNRIMNWIIERSRRKHMDHFHKWKWAEIALIIFVAIPLPMTGAWSGAVAAYILGISIPRAFLAISLGVAIAGIIVTLLMMLGLLATNGTFF